MHPAHASLVRVFIVEDSELVRERIETLAALAGAGSAGHAVGAGAAIRAILAERPDIVITDLKLAEGSGFDVLRAIHAAAPGIDLYMLSNFATEPYRRIARQLGARDFFDKSTEFRRVSDVISARVAAGH
jgi:DNA-binding NarL/FixJ family response regulator